MKSKSFEKVKYIIYTPKGVKTGGPEGMHQLAWALNKIGRQAVLLAWPNSQHNSPVVEYQKYNPKWCRISDINKKDIFIISESISFLPFWYFFFISKFRVYMWMHSVDFSLDNELNQYERKNYALNTEWNVNQNTVPQFKSIIKNIDIFGIYRKIIYLFNFFKKRILKKQIQILPSNYLFASYYSRYIVTKFKKSNTDIMLRGWANGIKSTNFNKIEFCSCAKNHVSFNPKKSKELISVLININESQNLQIHLIPISNIKTDAEVYKLLAFSDLYLDLGFFPGQERTPREAIMMNCPVLLAKRGAARFYEDFPLSDDYLLDLSLLGPNQTYEAILKILSKGKKHNLVEQNKFRELVINEKNTFLNEVKRFVQMIDRANG